MVLADMKLAANTPSDVIIFNIDAKSESDGKSNKDAIVNVFLKVFNNSLGFCGAIPYVADLERKLSEDGRYEDFKEAYKKARGVDWYEERHEFLSAQDGVVNALVDIGYMSENAAWNWCEKAIGDYQISIEDFAKRVKTYIDKKGGDHHVIFLVDEIGQYIGDDSKLMLNLQTSRTLTRLQRSREMIFPRSRDGSTHVFLFLLPMSIQSSKSEYWIRQILRHRPFVSSMTRNPPLSKT